MSIGHYMARMADKHKDETLGEIWHLMHKLWGDSKGSPGYSKEDWRRMQALIEMLYPPTSAMKRGLAQTPTEDPHE
jgi:hypothetical protein